MAFFSRSLWTNQTRKYFCTFKCIELQKGWLSMNIFHAQLVLIINFSRIGMETYLTFSSYFAKTTIFSYQSNFSAVYLAPPGDPSNHPPTYGTTVLPPFFFLPQLKVVKGGQKDVGQNFLKAWIFCRLLQSSVLHFSSMHFTPRCRGWWWGGSGRVGWNATGCHNLSMACAHNM